MAEETKGGRLLRRDYRTGPRLKSEAADLMAGVSPSETQGASWRGWVIGALCVTLVCLVIPYLDFVVTPSILTNSEFPATSVVFLFILLMALNAGLAAFRSTLGLTRQDLVLVFCMTMLANAIPGCGFWSFWAPTVIGGQYFQTPENNWELAVRQMPASWAPHDVGEYRPIEWFYIGVPNRAEDFLGRVRQVPWGAWVRPYALWCSALLMLFGVMFALSGLLRRQWSDHERLAFPLAQLPEELVSGVGTNHPQPFLKDKLAWWGIGLVFAFYAMNNLSLYFPQVPDLRVHYSIDNYLTEEPWSALRPFPTNIFISVVGLSYLVSLEVSFSVWFYWAVQKVFSYALIRAGVADNGWFFYGTQGGSYRGIFRGQGTGALLALAVLGFWMARQGLKESLKQAFGRRPQDPAETGFSPRLLWAVLTACAAGSVVWLIAYQIPWYYAVFVVVVLILCLTGLTRLFCESGVFYMQIYEFPTHLLQTAVTPSTLGTATFVKLSMWDRVMVSDWYRVAFMPVIMNSLHLATRTGLTRSSAMAGMAGAVLLALVVSFGSVLYTVYARPGGANTMAWYFPYFPKWEYGLWVPKVQQMEAYQKKLDQGVEVLPEDVPDVARHDWLFMGAEAAGAGYLSLSLWLRRFLFWFPHPLGYVMWMCAHPHFNTWFSFLIGWALKKGILKYGGSRAYLRARRFFIGLVIGEAFGVLLWKLVAAWTGSLNSYGMLPG